MKTKKKFAAEIEALRDELSVVRAQLEALQADAMLSDWQKYVGQADDRKVSLPFQTFPAKPDADGLVIGTRGLVEWARIATSPLSEAWPDTEDTDD
ncbi:MAG: hypothetical protein ACKOA5_12610 [Actinomycetota bacterium]